MHQIRAVASERASRRRAKQKKAGRAKGRKIVGLKIGASQIAAAVVAETDAGHELVELARRPLAAGIVVDGEVRDDDALAHALKAFFDEEKLPKNGRPHRPRQQPHRRPHARHRRRRRREPIRQRRSVQGPRGASRRRLTSRCSTTACSRSASDEDGEATRRVLLVVAPRDQVEPYQRSPQSGRHQARPAIDLEALGLLRAFVEPRTVRADARRHGDRRRRDRARVFDPARRRRRRVRVHARLRLGRRRAARMRSLPRSTCFRPRRRRSSVTSRSQARAASTTSLDDDDPREGDRCGAPAAHPVRTRARELAPVLPDPGRIARHRRDPDHRRHLAPRGARRRRSTR